MLSPNNACGELGGGPGRKAGVQAKTVYVSSAGSPTKPLAQAVGWLVDNF
jgi:hypothetical protein